MKVYLKPDTDSRGILRVVDALIKYAPPSVEVTESRKKADLEIIHVYGRCESVGKRIDRLREESKPYVMIQYALRSTMRPSTKDWINYWEKARLVWSYYNLPRLADEDLISGEFNFYHAPLGVDDYHFKDMHIPRYYTILASAQHALSESVRECAIATQEVGGMMFHLGHQLRRGDSIVCKSNISDYELAKFYSQSRYVSGLRRTEGFELPVIEGALCGARPIVFDRPEMRQWFNDFAIFIPEGPRDEVIKSLTNLFRENAVEVSNDEKNIILDKFNWSRIINGFWKEVL